VVKTRIARLARIQSTPSQSCQVVHRGDREGRKESAVGKALTRRGCLITAMFSLASIRCSILRWRYQRYEWQDS
jgi:hypothetical protein